MVDKPPTQAGARAASNEPSVRAFIMAWLEDITKLRDGLLVFGALCYFAGYLMWAVNAFINGLGLLPAFEFQYFIAGLIPVAFVCGLIFIVLLFRLLKRKTRAWVGDNPKGIKLVSCWIACVSSLLAVGGIFLAVSDWAAANLSRTIRPWISSISAFVIILSTSFFEPLLDTIEKKRKQRNFETMGDAALHGGVVPIITYLWGAGLLLGLLAVLFLVFAASIYSFQIYSQLPQEFGGVSPYPACIDITREKISKETADGIIPPEKQTAAAAVVRTRPLEVLFSGSELMIVRADGKVVYKIARSSIESITRCETEQRTE